MCPQPQPERQQAPHRPACTPCQHRCLPAAGGTQPRELPAASFCAQLFSGTAQPGRPVGAGQPFSTHLVNIQVHNQHPPERATRGRPQAAQR